MASSGFLYSAGFLRSLRRLTQPAEPLLKSHLRNFGVLEMRGRYRGTRAGRNLQRVIQTVVGNRHIEPSSDFICKYGGNNTTQTFQRKLLCEQTLLCKFRVLTDVPTQQQERAPINKCRRSMTRMLLTNTRSLLNKMGEFQAVLSTSAVDITVVTETWFTPNLPMFMGSTAATLHWLPRSVSSIALCAVYHAPNSTRGDELLQFLTDSIDDVLRQYPGTGVVVLGDFNRLDVSTVSFEHSLKPVVTDPTRENAILDQVLASDAITVLPPTVDPPLGASDHNCVIWSGCSTSGGQNRVVKKVVRPLRQSDLRSFGSWITEHDWGEVYSKVRATDKCTAFYSTLCGAIEKFFPSRTVRLHERDKPWVTPGLKAMILLRQKAFRDQNLPEVKRLRNKIARNIQQLKKTFYQQMVKSLKTADSKEWYQAIKGMGKMAKGQLTIDVPGVSASSAHDVANAINSHLSTASQKHEPLRLQDLPAYLPAPAPPPVVSVWDMWNRLKSVKIDKATGPEGISPRIIREFAFELSLPLTDIMNASLCQGVVPDMFKDADVVPVPKEMPPRLEKLRLISLTPIFAKNIANGATTTYGKERILAKPRFVNQTQPIEDGPPNIKMEGNDRQQANKDNITRLTNLENTTSSANVVRTVEPQTSMFAPAERLPK
ncbi:hypothetical protein Bbelb_020910 [Branchiostoma belcheri]|nr:hypothetical protein Bbelb_020910 [Branchiostoma belcheri]